MECTVSRILISGYIDNELSDDEMHQLKRHLQTCEACVAHLQNMERVQAAMKRFQLMQDVPQASPNFARNVSRVLQETTPVQPRFSRARQWSARYRAFVLRLVERWIASVRARPVTWVTSASCALILLVGAIVLDVRHLIQPPLQVAFVPVEERAQRAHPGPPASDISPAAEMPDSGASAPRARTDTEEHDLAALPDFIQFSDEPVVQIAHNTSEPVRGYVYSHIFEASQEQFLDNAVFAGYVQDALIQ